MSETPAWLGALAMPGVDQIGIVVRDLERTVADLSNLGIGPWEVGKAFRAEALVRGKPEVYKARIALAPLGAVQLEVIQHIAGHTIYEEHLDTKGEGLHHLGFLVPDFDERIAAMERRGIAVLQSIRFGRSSACAYLDTEKTSGIVFEFITATPGMLAVYERIRQNVRHGTLSGEGG